jgi:hypothetical protein
MPEGAGAELAAFVQQQVQAALQSALPHFIQQVADRARPSLGSPTSTPEAGGPRQHPGRHGMRETDYRESKVAEPERFSGKKGNEVYRWFAQLRLVFRGKPRTYNSDADKVAYALSYMSGAAQNWAMPLLQALDEGREHNLLENYDAFRESVIGVYGDLDRRGNAEDRLGRLRQTGSVAAYISTFNEYAAQVDWNESSLMARFRGGLKDEVLDSVATAETQPSRLHDWMAMASRIDERLWGRRQARRPSSDSINMKGAITPREPFTRGQVGSAASGPVPMELGAIRGPPALAKTAAERLEYQRQGKCWGCGQFGHVRGKCPTNPSRPLTIAAIGDVEGSSSGKDRTRD